MTIKKDLWTVVQHSGYVYGNDPTFKKGLEVKQISTAKESRAIIKAGGLLFDTREEAVKYEEKEVGTDMIPNAPGNFSVDVKIDGLRLYIPTVKTKKVEVHFRATFKTVLEVPVDATREQIGEEISNVNIPETDSVEYICDTFEPVTDDDGHPKVYKDSSTDD